MKPTNYAIKTAVSNADSRVFVFNRQKTMYGGKSVAAGDRVFIFDSENEGGAGLIAYGLVTTTEPSPRKPGLERQTPCVSVTIQHLASAVRRLGRQELKPFSQWDDGRPETELNFKFYRQATNKLVSVSPEAAVYLLGFFNLARDDQRRGGADSAALRA